MFSSNQRFLITGDKDNSLELALSCALSISVGGSKGIKGYHFDEEDGMILHLYITDSINDIVTKIPDEEVGNFKYLLLLIKQYLCSNKYNELLKKTKNDCYWGDGDIYRGWELGYYGELDKGYGWGHILYIKPYWTYYTK